MVMSGKHGWGTAAWMLLRRWWCIGTVAVACLPGCTSLSVAAEAVGNASPFQQSVNPAGEKEQNKPAKGMILVRREIACSGLRGI